jgi:SAM-dependent methyltransferase
MKNHKQTRASQNHDKQMSGKTLVNRLYQITYTQPTFTRLHSFDAVKNHLTPDICVLDIGSPKRAFADMCQHYVMMDIEKDNKPDVLGDAHSLPFKDETFDLVIANSVLEHFHEPWNAISEIHRILKKGGVIILSTPFFHRYHSAPNDYYRFTKDGLRYLLSEFEIQTLVANGGIFSSMVHLCFVLTYGLDLFYPLGFLLRTLFRPFFSIFVKLDWFDSYQLTPKSYVVVARK